MVVPDPEERMTPLVTSLVLCRRIERLLVWTLVGAAVFGTFVRYGGRVHWLFELTTHFVVQTTSLCAIASLLLLIRRHWRPAFVAIAMTLLNASEWVIYSLPTSQRSFAPSEENTISVASVNVFSRNRRASDVVNWLRQSQADVVFLSEVDDWWAKEITHWKPDWPHQIIHPRNDNFGVALISRFPLSHSEIIPLDGLNPAVFATVMHDRQAWSVVGLHPFPPAGRVYASLRNAQLATAARQIQKLPKPRIVLGDLNCTSSSPYFGDFVQAVGMVDSRYGFGWEPTWPARHRFLRIPIDHCLVEPGVTMLERSVGPDIGSDHLPIKAIFRRSRAVPGPVSTAE